MGPNLLMVEYTEHTSKSPFISGSYALSAGKYFNSLWGVRFELSGAHDRAIHGFDNGISPKYHFNHFGLGAELTMNFSNLFRSKDEQHDWNIELMAGPGLLHTYGFGGDATTAKDNELNTDARTYLTLYFGGAVSYKVSKDVHISLELMNNLLNDDFNGYVGDRGLEYQSNLLLGVRYYFGE